MKILVIPDVHLKPWMFDKAEEIDKNKYDNIVCLGDLVDEWQQQRNDSLYEQTLERVLSFDEEHPKMLWCWGNHDLSYKFCFNESGFSYQMIPLVGRYLGKMERKFGDRLKVIHKVDSTLFSHAGLTYDYTDAKCKSDHNEIGKIMSRINSMTLDEDHARKLWRDDSPIWIRPPKFEDEHWLPFWFKKEKFFQVVGHTPVSLPTQLWNTLILDTFSLYSNMTPIGNQKFVIIDTKEHTWEYA